MPGYWDATKSEPMSDSNWEVYSGAEAFTTGERPLYRDLPFGYAIADANGIEIAVTIIKGMPIYKWAQGELINGKNVPKWTYMMALLIINSLYFGESASQDPDNVIDGILTQYGFELIGHGA